MKKRKMQLKRRIRQTKIKEWKTQRQVSHQIIRNHQKRKDKNSEKFQIYSKNDDHPEWGKVRAVQITKVIKEIDLIILSLSSNRLYYQS